MQRRTFIFQGVFFILSLATFPRHLQGADWPAGFDTKHSAHRVPLSIVEDFYLFLKNERMFVRDLFIGKRIDKKEMHFQRICFQNAAFRLVHRIGAYRALACSSLRDDLLLIKAYCLYEIHSLNFWNFKNHEYFRLMETAYAIVSAPGFVMRLQNHRLRPMFPNLRRNVGNAYINWISPRHDSRKHWYFPNQEKRINRYLQVIAIESMYLIDTLPQYICPSEPGDLWDLHFYFHKLLEFGRFEEVIQLGRRLLEVVRSQDLLSQLWKKEADLSYSVMLCFYGAALLVKNQPIEFNRLRASLRTLPPVKLGKRMGVEDYQTAVLLLAISGFFHEQRQTGKTPSPERQQRVRQAFAVSFFATKKRPVGLLENFLNALPKKEREQIVRMLWPKE